MFTNPDSPDKSYPKLKGRGAEIKELVQPLLFAWEALVNCSDDFNHDVKAILETQIDIQTILHIHRDDTFLPVKVANRLRDCVDRFLSLYQGLAHASDQRKDLLFNLVPKLHWLWHLGQKAIFLNPRKDKQYRKRCEGKSLKIGLKKRKKEKRHGTWFRIILK